MTIKTNNTNVKLMLAEFDTHKDLPESILDSIVKAKELIAGGKTVGHSTVAVKRIFEMLKVLDEVTTESCEEYFLTTTGKAPAVRYLRKVANTLSVSSTTIEEGNPF